MLLTRCPECDTTFRVTDETLKKASGQVRCGRCASVFNAYAELHNPGAKSAEAEQPRAVRENPAAAPPKAPDRPQPAPTATAASATLVRLETKPTEPAATGIGSASMANVVAEANVAAADSRGRGPRRRRERGEPASD